MRLASTASISSPVSSMRNACARPTARGNRCVPTATRHETERSLRHGECRVLRRHANVAGQRQLEPHRVHRATQRRDHGLRHGRERLDPRGRPLAGQCRLAPAEAEVAALARDHHRAHGGVRRQSPPRWPRAPRARGHRYGRRRARASVSPHVHRTTRLAGDMGLPIVFGGRLGAQTAGSYGALDRAVNALDPGAAARCVGRRGDWTARAGAASMPAGRWGTWISHWRAAP